MDHQKQSKEPRHDLVIGVLVQIHPAENDIVPRGHGLKNSESQELPPVLLGNAIVDPRAVVVEPRHAPAAVPAVFRSQRPHDPTGNTDQIESPSLEQLLIAFRPRRGFLALAAVLVLGIDTGILHLNRHCHVRGAASLLGVAFSGASRLCSLLFSLAPTRAARRQIHLRGAALTHLDPARVRAVGREPKHIAHDNEHSECKVRRVWNGVVVGSDTKEGMHPGDRHADDEPARYGFGRGAHVGAGADPGGAREAIPHRPAAPLAFEYILKISRRGVVLVVTRQLQRVSAFAVLFKQQISESVRVHVLHQHLENGRVALLCRPVHGSAPAAVASVHSNAFIHDPCRGQSVLVVRGPVKQGVFFLVEMEQVGARPLVKLEQRGVSKLRRANGGGVALVVWLLHLGTA